MKRAGILGERGGRVNPFRESEQGHWSSLCFLRKYSVVQAGRNVSLMKSDQCASDLFRCRDSSPWPLLFLLGVQPGEDINHGLFGSMAEGFHPRNDRQLGGFHGVTCFVLLAPSDGVGAEVTELQDVAFSRLDEKTLFNDLAEPREPASPRRRRMDFSMSGMTSWFSSEISIPSGEPGVARRN